MPRAPGSRPQFERLIKDLQRATLAWDEGDIDLAERILKLIAYVAFAECEERGPNDPVPEIVQ